MKLERRNFKNKPEMFTMFLINITYKLYCSVHVKHQLGAGALLRILIICRIITNNNYLIISNT